MRRIRTGGQGEIVQPSEPSKSARLLQGITEEALRDTALIISSPTISDSWSDYMRNCQARGLALGTLRTYDLIRRQCLEAWEDGKPKLLWLTP